MDDLQLLRALGDETPLVPLPHLAGPRAKLTVAEAGKTRNKSSVMRARRPRPAFLGGVFAWGLAAALTVGVVVVVVAPTSRSGIYRTPEAPPAATNLSVTRVLEGASARALAGADVIPRPDQFYYSKWKYKGGETQESWWSVGGGRPALIRYTEGEDPVLQPCPKSCGPAYDPALPTDADAMLAYLKGIGVGDNLTGLSKFTSVMMRNYYLRPPVQAALFQALGKIEGVRVEPAVTDVAGRAGVGVTWTQTSKPGAKPVPSPLFIFDAKTYTFLGTRYEALIASAIVDRAGQ